MLISAYRSRTYGAMLLRRGFFRDPKQFEAPVKNMDKAVANADGSINIYLGPNSPGEEKAVPVRCRTKNFRYFENLRTNQYILR